MLADTASSADALFENYTARLALTDAVNQDEEQNWASYKAIFELSLAPRSLSGIRGLQPRINNLQTRDGS